MKIFNDLSTHLANNFHPNRTGDWKMNTDNIPDLIVDNIVNSGSSGIGKYKTIPIYWRFDLDTRQFVVTLNSIESQHACLSS